MVSRPQRAFPRLALRGDEVGAELARVEEVEVLRLVRQKSVGCKISITYVSLAMVVE